MQNDFYTLNDWQRTEGKLSCRLAFAPAHRIFAGHFPGNPIVPGVCTMAIVKKILEEALQQKLVLKESKGVKFLGLIDPTMSPTMSLSWNEEAGRFNATASLQDGAAALFKMSGSYVPASHR